MISGIVFDLDGTLIDDTQLLIAAESKAFASKGFTVTPEELIKYGGTSIKDLARAIMGDNNPALIKELRAIRKEEVMKNLDRVFVFPDALPVLEELKKRGLGLGVGTGLGRDLLPLFLEKTGLAGVLDVNVSADDVKNGKPAPDIFKKAFENLGIEPINGMVVGDSKNDILGARAVNALSVLIVRNDNPPCEADHIIHSLIDLLRGDLAKLFVGGIL